MQKYKEGEDVAHKDNLKSKMTIYEIFTETIQVSTGVLKPNAKEFEKKSKKIIRGIGCHWFGPENEKGEKELITHRFHSRELVPWDIAQKGIEEVIKYFETY